MQAMILAAGLGTRLRPYTSQRPKPMFPIFDQPLLGLTIAQLRRAGCGRIVINSHHLQSQIRNLVEKEADIILQEETDLLGTGGSLRRGRGSLDAGPILAVNGDIYHDNDYNKIFKAHQQHGAAVTMLLHDLPRFNTVAIDRQLQVTGFTAEEAGNGTRLLAFTGIHVINPEVLDLVPPGKFYSIIDCYRTLLAAGGIIRAEIVDGYWTDIGTPADYLALHAGLLSGTIPAYPELAACIGNAPESQWIGPGAIIGGNSILRDWNAIGPGARIGDNATLCRTVVWDRTEVPAGASFENCIVT